MFGTLVGVGGLNMVQPPHRLNIHNIVAHYTLPHDSRPNIFCPLTYTACHGDRPLRQAPYNQASRGYTRRITALCNTLPPPPPPDANPADLVEARRQQNLTAMHLGDFAPKHIYAIYGVSRFIALPDLDQRTLAVVYLLVEKEVKRRKLLHINKEVKEQ